MILNSMIQISYTAVLLAISIVWLIIRGICCIKNKKFDIKREALLLLVYVCLVVVARFTFFPFSKVDGEIQPLLFDAEKAIPRINLLPFVYLFDYPVLKEALLNLIGNITMFIPIGVVWPAVFRGLNSHIRVILAGVGLSLAIEILQLPFYDRVSDIDDLILNTTGFLIGYGIFILAKKLFSIGQSRFRTA